VLTFFPFISLPLKRLLQKVTFCNSPFLQGVVSDFSKVVDNT
jgi:hypothetical protein